MHGGNATSHEDTAENEVKRRSALATNDVKAAAGYDNRHHERKGRQSDVVGHRCRHDEGEHGDEVHRPYSTSHCNLGSPQPHATGKSPRGPHIPTEIESAVTPDPVAHTPHSDAIRIVYSGNDHRDSPNS